MLSVIRRLKKIENIVKSIPDDSLFARMTELAITRTFHRSAIAAHYILMHPEIAKELFEEVKIYLKSYIGLYFLQETSLVQYDINLDLASFEKLIKCPPHMIDKSRIDAIYNSEISIIKRAFTRRDIIVS